MTDNLRAAAEQALSAEPVAWVEAESAAKCAPLVEVLRGWNYSTRWHYQTERPTVPAGNALFAVYSSPQPTTVPLTDEQIMDIITTIDRTSDDVGPFFDTARAIERAHGIGDAT